MEWALVASSVVLVFVTACLAWFTRNLAKEAALTRKEMQSTRAEMEETRRLGVRPRLALEVVVLSPLYGVLAIRNLGPGAALNIALRISFDPPGERRDWAWPTMMAGERHEFILPDGNLDNAQAANLNARVTGSYEDIYGTRFAIDASHGFAEWWSVARRANRRFERPPLERVASFLEAMAKSAEQIARR